MLTPPDGRGARARGGPRPALSETSGCNPPADLDRRPDPWPGDAASGDPRSPPDRSRKLPVTAGGPWAHFFADDRSGPWARRRTSPSSRTRKPKGRPAFRHAPIPPPTPLARPKSPSRPGHEAPKCSVASAASIPPGGNSRENSVMRFALILVPDAADPAAAAGRLVRFRVVGQRRRAPRRPPGPLRRRPWLHHARKPGERRPLRSLRRQRPRR